MSSLILHRQKKITRSIINDQSKLMDDLSFAPKELKPIDFFRVFVLRMGREKVLEICSSVCIS